MARLLTRWFDLRAGEAGVAVRAFATLFSIVAAHTMLETARDALFLSKLPPSQLNLVYVALAGASFVAASAGVSLGRRFGRRNALIGSLVVAAYVATLFDSVRTTPNVALALYVFSGVVGAVLAPQFWLLSARIFTVSQGRRLFSPIASGGVLGGVVGAGIAAATLQVLPVTALLPVSAGVLLATALLLTTIQVDDTADAILPASAKGETAKGTQAMRREPFLLRIAALVVLSTAAVLTVDYFFKSTVARLVPAAELGRFFARFYAAMNGVSLLVQLFLANRLLRRLGVVGAVCVMPLLLMGGGGVTLVLGGALFVALGTKTIDGGLRHSLNRISNELLYLPLPAEARERGKSFIDGVLGRIVQAVMGGALYLLAMRGLDSPQVLAAIIVALSLGWLGVAMAIRAPYLDLFRRAVAGGALDPGSAVDDLDLDSADALVEALAGRDTTQVVSAMNVLVQKKRGKLIPALVLYHDAEPVLVRALEIFGASERIDWMPLTERLFKDPRESVRIATVRALAKHGELAELERAAEDASSAVQAYAAFYLAHRDEGAELEDHPLISAMMGMTGEYGLATRRSLLAAVADSHEPRAAGLVLAFAKDPATYASLEATENVATAMARIKDPRFIAPCIERLGVRQGRDAIRSALVAMGEPALDALEHALKDAVTDRRVRLHVPRTIARFDLQRACDVLTAHLDTEKDGAVRFKILRGLGKLCERRTVTVDRPRVEGHVRRNLEEHLRVLAHRVRLGARPKTAGDLPREPSALSPSWSLLLGLLEDKGHQALERAFRLLKIANPDEDIQKVHGASQSRDRRARANAGEFLDVLLARRDQAPLRQILRVVIDDLDDEDRVTRARAIVPDVARTREEALRRLIGDRDEVLAELAAQHASPPNEARHG